VDRAQGRDSSRTVPFYGRHAFPATPISVYSFVSFLFHELPLFLKHSFMKRCSIRNTQLAELLHLPDSQFMILDLLKSNSTIAAFGAAFCYALFRSRLLTSECFNIIFCGLMFCSKCPLCIIMTRCINTNDIRLFSNANSNIRTFATVICSVLFHSNLLNFAYC
jgi:hypothetical protein